MFVFSPRFDLPLYDSFKGQAAQVICHGCGEPGHKLTVCPMMQQYREKQLVILCLFLEKCINIVHIFHVDFFTSLNHVLFSCRLLAFQLIKYQGDPWNLSHVSRLAVLYFMYLHCR